MSVKPGSKWTEAEVNYLLENAGKKSLEQIARRLGRSYKYTLKKAGDLGLGDGKLISTLYTSNQLAKILGVASSTVGRWTDEMGLPFKWKKFRSTFRYKMIDMADFFKWAESHQDILDTRKFKLPNLGNEPAWLAEKRKKDAQLPAAHNRVWNRDEELRLISLVNAGVSKLEIARLLNRTESGVQRKIDRLKAIGDLPIDRRGEFYSDAEERLLLKCKAMGMTHRQIAQKLRRSKHSVDTKYRMLKLAGVAK